MLKKAGIVVAAAAATLLAVSPLAFAQVGAEHHNGGSEAGNSIDHTSMGLVNVSDNNVNGTANGLCNNDVTGALGVAAQKGVPAQGVLGALAPVTSNNAIGVQDGRNCSIDSTSAGDSAGDK